MDTPTVEWHYTDYRDTDPLKQHQGVWDAASENYVLEITEYIFAPKFHWKFFRLTPKISASGFSTTFEEAETTIHHLMWIYS